MDRAELRMAGSVLFKSVAEITSKWESGQGINNKMRFSWAVAVLVAGLSVSGVAQQAPYKVKPSHPDKPAKSSAPVGRTGGAGTASADNAKSLQTIEHENSKVPASSKVAGQKSAALKPVKDKPNPPMNFGSSSGVKGGSKPAQGSSAYKGRLRQKGAHQ